MHVRVLCGIVIVALVQGVCLGQDRGEAVRLYNVGVAHVLTGRDRDAVDCFKRVLQHDSSYIEAWIQLGQAYLRMDQRELGLNALNKAIAAAPFRADARIALGTAYLEMGRGEEAKDTFNRAKDILGSADIATLLAYAMTGRKAGLTNAPEEALRYAIRLKPTNVQEWLLMGILYTEGGDLDRAILALENATLTPTPPPEAWANLGIVYMRKGSHGLAAQMFARAYKQGMVNRQLLVNLGSSLSECGRLDDTIVVFKELTKRYPDFAEGWYNLGVASARHGWVDEAIRYYEKAMQLKPDYPEAVKALNDANEFRRLLDADPASKQSLYQIAP